MINVIVADDHKIVLDGLESVLTEDQGVKVLGVANTGQGVLELLEKVNAIDVVVLDIELGDLDGIEVSRVIRRKYPKIKILILSMYNKKAFTIELMKAGVSGYVLKNKSKEQLIGAIHQVYSENSYFGLEVLEELSRGGGPVVEEETVILTDRESEILALIGEALTAKEISSLLRINETTVNTHKRNLRHKLSVPNEKHLIRYAIKYGYAQV